MDMTETTIAKPANNAFGSDIIWTNDFRTLISAHEGRSGDRTVELTRRRESKHPPPHQASCERRSRRSRPTIYRLGGGRSHRTRQLDARARLVALNVDAWIVEEHRFVRSQTSSNGRHDISRTSQARFTVADSAAALSPLRIKPLINEIEIGTA